MMKIVVILAGLLLSLTVNAQVTVHASLDSTDIFIGQQAHIALKVTADSKSKVVFPVYPSKQLVKGVEVLKEEVVATEKLNNGEQQSITKCYTITSFDSAIYYLPPMKVKVELLPYHDVGKDKHRRLWSQYNPDNLIMEKPDETTIQRCIGQFSQYGIEACEG